MGYSNGQLETSSGTGLGERGEPGLPGIGFQLTDDGNFDLDSKRLTDVADPVDDQDAATKKYVDDHITSGAASKKYVDDENAKQDIAINSKAEKNSVLMLDGTKSMTGNLQMGSKRIRGLADGSDDGDAINLRQLSGSPAKSGPLDFGTKNNFPSFFVSEKGLVHIYKNAIYYFPVLYFCFATS